MNKPEEKIKVSAGEDLLAFIPHMVGYWPDASVVCIGMAGKQLRATMRLDLPEEHSPGVAQLAHMASAQMASDSVSDGCLLAIFAPEDWTDPGRQPHARLYAHLLSAFAQQGLPVKDAWFVGGRHWRNVFCTEAACCPWPGKDNSSIRESFVNAEFIYRGSMVREPPERQIRDLSTPRDPKFVLAVAQAAAPLRDALAACGAGSGQLAVTLGAWEKALSRWPLTPDATAATYLLASLGDCQVRDAVMVALATTAEQSLMGAVGLGLVSADDGQQLLLPGGRFEGHEGPCCPVACEEAQQDGLLAAMNNFSKTLVGDLIHSGTAKTAQALRKSSGTHGRPRPLPGTPGEGTARTAKVALASGPDWERLDRAEPLLQFLARSTEGPDRAPVLCILGWIQWCKGRGTWAGHYFAASQKSQPGYKLAALLDQLLAVGHIAQCAKDRRTAWRGYGAGGRGAQGGSDVA